MDKEQLKLLTQIQALRQKPYAKHTTEALEKLYKEMYESIPKEKTPKT